MLDINEQDISKWSYYDSMIRSQNIQKGLRNIQNRGEHCRNDQK